LRFRRTLTVALAGVAAMASIAISAGFPTASARAAVTSVPLPIGHYSHMLVDQAHQHIYFTSGPGYGSSILVTDYSGQTVATIPNEPGATGLALSSDGSTVYAALANGEAVSAISTSTLTETARYDTGAGTTPLYVAYTSGKIWFGDGDGIGSIDPSTTPATITPKLTNDLYGGIPMLAASPSGVLAASATTTDPTTVFTYDVSSGTPAPLASRRLDAENAGFVDSLAVTPDGKDVVLASGGPSYAQVYRTSDLSADDAYHPPGAPGDLDSVSISGDGSVAVGTFALVNSVSVFASGGSTPLNTYNFGSNWVYSDGVALTPDGSDLFAVTSATFGGAPTLNIIPEPEQVPSSLGLAGPASAKVDQAITLTGALGGTSPYTGGQTLQVTRFDPANPGGVALPDVTTAADGSFSITDTPPKVTNTDTGTVTYQVSYAGDVHLSASTASVSVTVHYNGS
jgi:hypothetical protein